MGKNIKEKNMKRITTRETYNFDKTSDSFFTKKRNF